MAVLILKQNPDTGRHCRKMWQKNLQLYTFWKLSKSCCLATFINIVSCIPSLAFLWVKVSKHIDKLVFKISIPINVLSTASIKDPLEDKQTHCVHIAQFDWLLQRQFWSTDIKERGKKTFLFKAPLQERKSPVCTLGQKKKSLPNPQTLEENCLSKYQKSWAVVEKTGNV